MIIPLSAHDHGNCELCDWLESQNAALATRLEAIMESLVTQEPRRDCVAALSNLVKNLRQPAAVDAVAPLFAGGADDPVPVAAVDPVVGGSTP